MRLLRILLAAALCAGPWLPSASADKAHIVDVRVTQQGNGTFRFNVTVRHADEGWDHYANGWVVLTPNGERQDYRTLYHPHVDEQPFTRSLSGVAIPGNVDSVVIRAQDSVHGWGGREITVRVPR